MWRPILGLLLVSAMVGAAYLMANYRTEIHRDEDGQIQQITITPLGDQSGVLPYDFSPSKPPPPTIRIATLNLGLLDERRLSNRQACSVVVGTIAKFDVVAIQDVRAKDHGLLVRLVDQINTTERSYDFAISESVRGGAARRYGAFVFDKATIEIDRSMVHAVEDPAGGFHHEPLVALFRARGPKETEAFTFKLINVHVDADRAAVQLDLLDDVYRVVRDDHPTEDDVIILGDFATDYQRIGPLREMIDLTASITGTPTSLTRNGTLDNIFLNRRATVEFTGRSGVFDLVREFDLTLQEVGQITEHLPVWAEFSPYEGGQLGHVAGATKRKVR